MAEHITRLERVFMFRSFLLALVVVCLFFGSAVAQGALSLKIEWDPVTEYSDDSPIGNALLSYTLFICDTQIKDDNSCTGQLKTVKVNAGNTEAGIEYSVSSRVGVLYVRGNASTADKTSELSNQIEFEYNVKLPNTLNIRILLPEQ
jgi:hypothetical protein